MCAIVATSHYASMQANLARQHRLRIGRYSTPGGQYLVTVVVDARRPLFADFERACAAAAVLHGGDHWRRSRNLCWVLMPDHFHVLLEIGEGDELSRLVARLKRECTLALHAVEHSRAPIWQRGFHDRALRRDEKRRSLARYIIGNPVRAGMVQSVRAYPFWNAVWL